MMKVIGNGKSHVADLAVTVFFLWKVVLIRLKQHAVGNRTLFLIPVFQRPASASAPAMDSWPFVQKLLQEGWDVKEVQAA